MIPHYVPLSAWINFHNDLIPRPGSYTDSPVTKEKVFEQLKDELARLNEARDYANKKGDGTIKTLGTNERKVYPKASRNDCCMFGD